MTTHTAVRRYDIDSLRVLGTLAVFLFHCIQPFNPNDHWHIRNNEQSEVLGAVVSLLNIWVMPMFMFLAGAAAFYGLRKKTIFSFLWERTWRLFFPLATGTILFVAPQVYVERLSTGSFNGNFWEFLPSFFYGVYPDGNFSWHHLWFLAYLFVYSIAALPIFVTLMRQSTLISQCAVKIEQHPYRILLLGIPLALFHFLLFPTYPQTNALLNDWAWHAQLFTAFVYGFLLVSREPFENGIAKIWQQVIVLACILSGIIFAIKYSWILNHNDHLVYVVKATIYRLASWCWIIGIFGWARARLNKPSKSLLFASAASFPVYILHQTFIVIFAYFVVQTNFSITSKLLILGAISLMTTGLCYGIYEKFLISESLLA